MYEMPMAGNVDEEGQDKYRGTGHRAYTRKTTPAAATYSTSTVVTVIATLRTLILLA